MIIFNRVTKTYNKNMSTEINAIDDLSFSIEEGKITSIIGKSGSGKTTIVNVLLGVSKITSGEISISGIIINKKSKRKEFLKITKILLSSFQYPDHQLFKTTVRDEILFNSDDTEYMEELITKFNFDKELLDLSPFKLSSGQKRKLILISLLIQKPKIIILDEATAFLDPRTRREFVELIKEINKNFGMTILFISHNMNDVKNISKKTIIIDKGKKIDEGNSEDIVNKFQSGHYE